jgi:hypothetical protein
MSTINDKHVTYSSTSYTNRRNTGYGWLNRFFESNVGAKVVPTFQDEIGKLRSRDRVAEVGKAVKRVIKLGSEEWTRAELKDLNTLVEYTINLTETLISEKLIMKLCNEQQFKAQLSELVGIPRALCLLFYNAGLKMEDFAHEVNNFSRVKDGVIEIRSPKKNQTRVLTDENCWGLTPEECSEVVELITEKLESTEAAMVKDLLYTYTKKWKYTPMELRASHGVNLINQGLSWDEAARIQGVGTNSFKRRTKEYLAAQ